MLQHVGRARKVVIAHPGRQHSHQAALALEQAGVLKTYWTGVPCLPKHARGFPKEFWRRHVRYSTVSLPQERVHWLPVAPLLMRIGRCLISPRMSKVLEYAGYWLFDAWVATRLAGNHAEVVIAYENAARETFKMAKRLGMMTVLDAASIHHVAQDRLHEFSESAKFHRKVVMRKDEEIAYADYIVTCSDMARETYIEAGVPPGRVHTIGLGTDVNFFTPGESKARGGQNGFTFLFVGESSPHKGVDVLLRAFDRVAQRHRGIHLRLVGPPGEQHRLLDRTDKHAVQIAGRKSHAELLEEYRCAQCMVLPSRQDAYGLVVAEALACGVPVIVSDMVGAKDLIRAGTNGWVLPANDVEALATRMMWCVEHPDVLYSMRKDARASAVVARWERYHEQLVAFVLSLRGR